MPASRAARRAGQFCTGLGALIVLIGLLVGAPLALLALAGNPLPDHVPGLDEIGTALTSRDDGQLFLRALAVVGWAGWATFALSVLVEIPARILRRPAIRLPGLGRQQRWAATLVGSVALVLAVSPAATAASTVLGPTAAAAAAQPGLAGPPETAGQPVGVGQAAPGVQPVSGDGPASGPAPHWLAAEPASGPAPQWLAGKPEEQPEPVYRVEKGDYLGHIAGRYLGDFDRYPELARLNEIRDPDRIRPGQLLNLPPAAEDRGARQHATGLVATPPPPGGWPQTVPADPAPKTGQPEAGQPEAPQPPPGTRPPAEPPPAQPSGGDDDGTTYRVTASRAGAAEELNRPLAVSAVIAVASIVGAQVGAVFGLRNRSGRRPSFGNGRHRQHD
ncbi:peptidoglycan-binding protein [Plantactinospora sp. BC1]|uniref:LysM peptidoglycan-binding domain-containing protein n=1 Tax=Plantactinospora sp. BC1 TaxID=2108470 RepID=UPI000D17898F|nr:LysM peptidoglycan-binding domain-containing protein [Plantactinospora sp. BC1]AVT33315.1 peptidoglycan-binding protein [Plantactinospora sp. BC1]